MPSESPYMTFYSMTIVMLSLSVTISKLTTVEINLHDLDLDL